MTHTATLKIRWDIILPILLMFLLATTIVSTVFLYLYATKPAPSPPPQGGDETSASIYCVPLDRMWSMQVKLTPNRAVFDSNNPQLNVSIQATEWNPFISGWRDFHFNVSIATKYNVTTISGFPQFVIEETALVAEKNVSAYKSEDQNYYYISANFTITIDTDIEGIHVYVIQAASWVKNTLSWRTRGEAIFAVNVA